MLPYICIYFSCIFFVVAVFHQKICVFIIFISFFDEVSNFSQQNINQLETGSRWWEIVTGTEWITLIFIECWGGDSAA